MSVEEAHHTTPVPQFNMSSHQNIGFDDVWAIILERAWIIVVCLVACILGGYAHLARSPKIYIVSTQLKVEPKKNIVDIKEVQRENSRSYDVMKTMLVMLRSQPLMERVAKRVHLGKDKAFLDRFNLPNDEEISDESAATYLASCVVPRIVDETTLINVGVEHTDTEVAAKLSKVIAEEFILKNIDDRGGVSVMVQTRLSERADEQLKKVQELQGKLQNFRESQKVVALDSSEIENLNNKFNEIRKKRISMESDLKEIETNKNDSEKLLGIPSVESDQSVITFRTSIADQQEKIAKLTQFIKEDHPRLIKARAELASMQQDLLKAARNAAVDILSRYNATLSQERDLEKIVLDRAEKSSQYGSLRAELDQEQRIYLELKSRVKETEVTKALDFDDVMIVQDSLYGGLVRPDKKKILMASVAGGICLGFVMAFTLHLLDSTVKTPDQVEQSILLPVLTVISEAKRLSRPKLSRSPAPDKVTPAIREAFRSLVVALKLLGKKSEGRVFLFTSALPAEGKTFCSYHCAVQLAQQGSKTLLVDADLRKPYLHQLVKGSKLSPGLSDVLSDQATLEQVVLQTEVDNLLFLSAGTRSPNPPKLLSGSSLSELIEYAKSKFDYIILDSAPVNAVADSLLLAQYVQHVCMIARSGVTPERALKKAVQSIYESTTNLPCGVVLNRYRRRRGLYYYYNYSYHKSYGEHGSYGEGGGKSKKNKEAGGG